MAKYTKNYAKRKRSFRRRNKVVKSARGNSNWAVKAYNPRAPFGDKIRANLIYAEEITINPLPGVAGVYIYSANGLFDPNITGVGHQPRGFDQIMPLFDHYVVIGAVAEISFCPTSTFDSRLGVFVKDNVVPEVTFNDYIEQGHKGVHYIHSSNDMRNPKQVVRLNPNKYLGRSKPLSDSSLKGSVVNNPLEQAYFHIVAAGFGSDDEPALNIQVRITYTAMFIEPNQPAQS